MSDSKNSPVLLRFILPVVCVLCGLAVWGIVARVHHRNALQAEAQQRQAEQFVAVVKPQHGQLDELILPGDIQALTDAPIYARTGGYLKRRLVDIGDQVHSGQLLAEIDSPELDQQLHQVEADLETAQANFNLARSLAERAQKMLAAHYISRQEADQKQSESDARQAMVSAAQANVNRLRELSEYKKITAPFDGRISARTTDIGALISAGNGSKDTPALFHVVDVTRLRVYVHVPQMYAPMIKPGMQADLLLREYPGRVEAATLVRSSGAIDTASRTLLAEFDLSNAAGDLLPGAYSEVHLHLPVAASVLRVPSNTLLFGAQGMRVAVVSDNRVALKAITLGRDFGSEVEVLTGIAADDAVVVNPPDSLADGQAVSVLPAAAKP